MAVTSDEVNYLVFRYLQESGFYHTAFVFSAESAISKTKIKPTAVPTGSLVSFLQKGLQYSELEAHIGLDGHEETRCKVPFSLSKKHECRMSAHSSSSSLAHSVPSSSTSTTQPPSPPPSSTPRKQPRRRKNREASRGSLPRLGVDSLSDDSSNESAASLADDPVTLAYPAPGAPPTIIPESHVTVFRGHQSEVFICSWNPVMENIIASGSGDSTARIWELPDKSGPRSPIILKHSMHIPDGSSKDVTTIDWNPEGKLLATGGYDGIARIWDLNGQLLHSLKKHEGPIFSTKWNPRGDLLLSGSVDKGAIVWDAAKGVIKQQYEFHTEPTLDVDWRDNSVFATCSQDRNIYVCEVGKLTPVRCMKGHEDEVNAIKWDPSGRILASCSDDRTAKLWSIGSEGYLYDLAQHTREIYTITWSTGHGPSRLATASFDNDIRLWDPETGKCVDTLVGHTDPVYSVAFNPTGDLIASGSFDRKLHIWSVKDGTFVASFEAAGGIFEVGWSASGNHIAVADSNQTLSVLDVRFLRTKM
ncbi:MAG: hypothetical protein Q8P67_07975 [archaeon]|nr:hypothetical protein [archaeon]